MKLKLFFVALIIALPAFCPEARGGIRQAPPQHRLYPRR